MDIFKLVGALPLAGKPCIRVLSILSIRSRDRYWLKILFAVVALASVFHIRGAGFGWSIALRSQDPFVTLYAFVYGLVNGAVVPYHAHLLHRVSRMRKRVRKATWRPAAELLTTIQAPIPYTIWCVAFCVGAYLLLLNIS